jgi:hypothetical protein
MRNNLLKKFFKNMGEKMARILDFGQRRGEGKNDGGGKNNPEKKENGPAAVEIVRYVAGKPEPIIFVRCELAGEEVRLTVVEDDKSQEDLAGAQNIFKSLQEMGVFSAAEQRDVYPKDGRKFLEALLQNYDHPYLLARVIKENPSQKFIPAL